MVILQIFAYAPSVWDILLSGTYLLTFSLSFKAELVVGTIPQSLKPESGTPPLAEIIVV